MGDISVTSLIRHIFREENESHVIMSSLISLAYGRQGIAVTRTVASAQDDCSLSIIAMTI